MLFNSVHFLLFFPVVCALSFCWRSVRSRNLFLLLASYYFYMNWQPVYALLLLTSTLITYFAALFMAKSELHSVRRRLWLALSIVLNLSILFLFKYYQFVDAATKEQFDGYIQRAKEKAFYDTGVSAEYGDKLITLSTCEYSGQNSRLVVVAKKVTESGGSNAPSNDGATEIQS